MPLRCLFKKIFTKKLKFFHNLIFKNKSIGQNEIIDEMNIDKDEIFIVIQYSHGIWISETKLIF